jgi:regulator of nonsense transcripts 2
LKGIPPWRLRQLTSKQEHDEESDHGSDYDRDDEAIVVTRPEEAVDPEDEADFDREFAKMMAESIESRKFERKQQFDVPLPMRVKAREGPGADGDGVADTASVGNPTMAFSLLTKKGNRQQVLITGYKLSRVLLTRIDSYGGVAL